jgi:dicarboxylate transporter 10
MLMTAGQLASYDSFKHFLVDHEHWDPKKSRTHLTASCLAGVVATVITQPVDVIKTRIMNAGKEGLPPSTAVVVKHMLTHEGPAAFFKGFVPALTRLGPHTIATFLFLERLKIIVGTA